MRWRFVLGLAIVTVLLVGPAFPADDRYGDALPDGATQRLGTRRLRCGISDLCYLPDGRGALAIGGRVEIWNLAQGELEATHNVCKTGISSIQARRDGKALLVGDRSGKVHEWDLQERRALHTWPTQQQGLVRAVYSPDEKRVLTTGSSPPTLKEWEPATGKELVSITGTMHRFCEGIYGPNGTSAIADGSNGSGLLLAQYHLADGPLQKEWLKDYYTHSRSMELSADGTRLLVGSRHKATEWLLDGWKLLKKYTGHHGHAVTSVAYCKDPNQILTGSRDGSIRRWSRTEGKVLLRWCPHSHHVRRIAVSPDGKWVLSYGGNLVAETSMATGEPRLKWDRHDQAVHGVAFLPDGRRVVSGSADGTLRVWDITTGRSLRTIPGATLGAYAVAVLPDGSRVAAGCKDGVVREFSVADGALLRELKGHHGYIRAVAYTHDGARLLSTAGDGSIRVWAMDKAEPVSVLQGHQGGVLAVAVSANDRQVVSGGRDGTVRLWDLVEGKLLKTLKGHRSWVAGVAFCGDGQLLSGGDDARALRWNAATGERVGEMPHKRRDYALACTADGTRMYSGGDNRGLARWDLASGKLLTDRAGHGRAVRALALSPDGKTVVTASEDTTLLVWDVSQ